MDFNDSPTVQVGKAVDDWTHKEFLKYWDNMYMECVDPVYPKRTHNENMKLKAAVNSSITRYGRKVLKDMVDYAFNNYKDFPSWTMNNPMLVFAAHGWSALIYSRVRESMNKPKITNDLDEILS